MVFLLASQQFSAEFREVPWNSVSLEAALQDGDASRPGRDLMDLMSCFEGTLCGKGSQKSDRRGATGFHRIMVCRQMNLNVDGDYQMSCFGAQGGSHEISSTVPNG